MDLSVRNERFVKLFALHQSVIFRYVLTIVPNHSDAEEVLQETAAALWRKFDEYRQGEPFVPWALRFAYFEAIRHRRSNRHNALLLPEDLMESLAAEWSARSDLAEDRAQVLSDCVAQLAEADRRLLKRRYEQQGTIEQLAQATGRTANTLYKALGRIRRVLMECVDRKLETERGL